MPPAAMPSRLPPFRLAERLVQFALPGAGLLLTAGYLLAFADPPYPALVPAAFWLFYFAYLGLLWLLRALAPPAPWQQSLALGAAAALTVALYLAGQVGEQQRQADLQERRLSD